MSEKEFVFGSFIAVVSLVSFYWGIKGYKDQNPITPFIYVSSSILILIAITLSLIAYNKLGSASTIENTKVFFRYAYFCLLVGSFQIIALYLENIGNKIFCCWLNEKY